MRVDKVLYESEIYQIVQHGDLTFPDTIVNFSNWSGFKPTPERKFPVPFVPPSITNSTFPANFVSFVVNRNNWYGDEEAHKAAEMVAKVIAGTRVLTYGSTMGGYAAMNFAAVLDAKMFLALSPQVTVFHPFMGNISDRRYVADVDPFKPAFDNIALGKAQNRKGIIFLDSFEPMDVAHAGRAACLTRAVCIDLPHVGHPVTSTLNRILPLREILQEIVEDRFDVAKTRMFLRKAARKLPEYQGAHPSRFVAFLMTCQTSPGEISPQAFYNAVRTMRLHRQHWPPRPAWSKAVETIKATLPIAANNWQSYQRPHEAVLQKQLAEIGS